jgi:hypothetical protein
MHYTLGVMHKFVNFRPDFWSCLKFKLNKNFIFGRFSSIRAERYQKFTDWNKSNLLHHQRLFAAAQRRTQDIQSFATSSQNQITFGLKIQILLRLNF